MAGANRKQFRNEMQAKGISEPGLKKGVPMKATPVSKPDIGLGAKTFPHPFLKNKPNV